MKNNFDSNLYWQKRLKNAGKSLKGVGLRRFDEHGNFLMYKRVKEVLDKIFKNLDIPLKKKKVLDAGAGIGMFTDYYVQKGANVTAIDISSDALKILKKKYPTVKTMLTSIERYSPKKESFDIVHCFDVVYHITDDKCWEKAIKNLAKSSKKYILIHAYAERWDNFLESRHVKVKRKRSMETIFKEKGFERIAAFPTHILYIKTPLHILSSFFPNFFYSLDSFLLNKIKIKGIETQNITVFRKKF